MHCAVLGGSLSLLKWLVEDHYCPLRATSVGGRRRDSGNSYTPILTSRGRSVLGIAMENESLEIVRYLVVEKGMALAEVKNLSLETTITTLQAALHLIPTTADGGIQVYTSTQPTDAYDSIPAVYSPPHEYSSPVSVTCSQHEAHASSPGETVEGTTGNGGRIDDVSSDSLEDAVSSLMIVDENVTLFPRNCRLIHSLLIPDLFFLRSASYASQKKSIAS